MKKRWAGNLAVEMLAYAYNYVYLIVIASMILWVRREYYLLAVGLGVVLYAAYGVIGYLCRWKHIYCAYQCMHHKTMTPEDIRWHKIKKREAYGIPAIFAVLGIGLLVLHFVQKG